MKKLLYDLVATQPGGNSKRHGGGKYGEMIFYRMVERGIPFSCIYDSGQWLNPEIEEVCRQKGIPLYDCHTKKICDIIKEHGIERLYSALLAKWLRSVPDDIELYGTLHGLRGLETPMDNFFLKYKNTFRQTVRYYVDKFLNGAFTRHRERNRIRLYFKLANFVTVSEHSRLAIKSWFPEYKEEVRCFYSPNTSRGGGNKQL